MSTKSGQDQTNNLINTETNISTPINTINNNSIENNNYSFYPYTQIPIYPHQPTMIPSYSQVPICHNYNKYTPISLQPLATNTQNNAYPNHEAISQKVDVTSNIAKESRVISNPPMSIPEEPIKESEPSINPLSGLNSPSEFSSLPSKQNLSPDNKSSTLTSNLTPPSLFFNAMLNANEDIRLYKDEQIPEIKTSTDNTPQAPIANKVNEELNSEVKNTTVLSKNSEILINKSSSVNCFGEINSLNFFSPQTKVDSTFLKNSNLEFRPEIINHHAPRKQYRVNDKNEIIELNQDNKDFEYDATYDKKYLKNKVVLYIKYIPVIKEQGIIAASDIDAGEIIGIYHGNYLTDKELDRALKDSTNQYLYQITNSKGEIIACIDAKKKGNWARFVNHSFTPNLEKFDQANKKIRGRREVVFRTLTKIKAGEQLSHNYGEFYFESNKLFYLDASDNEYSYIDNYQQNKSCYSKNIYKINTTFKRDLGFPQNALLLVPEIFFDIEKNDVVEINTKIKGNYPKELYAYCVTDNSDFMDASHQSHMTPLIYACYLQKMESIRVLIDAGANVDKYTFNQGQSPIMVLLSKDPVNNKNEIEEIAIKLFNKMQYPFVHDVNGFNILHYAIKWNLNSLLLNILHRADKSKNYLPCDITTPLIENNTDESCHFDFCLRKRRFETLKIMLDRVVYSKTQLLGNIKNYINNGQIFTDETLEGLPADTLKEFADLIANYNLIKDTSLPDRLSAIINNKSTCEVRK